MVLGHLGQLLWLAAGSRAMSRELFGTVLAAQALYAVLQLVVDNGAGFHGARLAAGGELDDALRASIIRIRLQLSVGGAIVAAAVGVVGGAQAFLAFAPFSAALVLWSLFGYWERFGLGESGPWSGYLVLRSAAPAGAAALCVALAVGFPAPLAGLSECAAIAVAAGASGLRPRLDLAAALSAERGPWRQVIGVGAPAVLWQVALSSGTVLLNTFGAPAAAAVYGVAIRLLTGLNQLAAVAATAFFPGLAARAPSEPAGGERAALVVATRLALMLGAAAAAVVVALPEVVVEIFASRTDAEAEETAILMLGAASATASVIVVSWLLIARRAEDVFLLGAASGSALVVAGGLAVTLGPVDSKALAMGAVFVAAQVTTALIVLVRAGSVFPASRTALRLTLAVALATAGAAAVASQIEAARGGVAVGLAAVAAAACLAVVLPRR